MPHSASRHTFRRCDPVARAMPAPAAVPVDPRASGDDNYRSEAAGVAVAGTTIIRRAVGGPSQSKST